MQEGLLSVISEAVPPLLVTAPSNNYLIDSADGLTRPSLVFVYKLLINKFLQAP